MRRVISAAAAASLAASVPSGAQDVPAPKSEAIERARAFLRDGRLLEGGKVVGGQRTILGDDPWQVALIFPLSTTDGAVRLFCGGSLVAPQWVLTAAHCVDGATGTDDFAVIAGRIDLYSPVVPSRADRILVHPGWRPAPLRWNDVALVHLEAPVTSGNAIALTAASSDPDSVAAGLPGRVTGWGAVGETGGSVQFLRYVTVTTVARTDCEDRASHRGRLTSGMFCAGFGPGGRDSCQGDSGGPLSTRAGGVPRLVGIVSWGEGCGNPAKYGVYTRVAAYADWVRLCLAASTACDWKRHE